MPELVVGRLHVVLILFRARPPRHHGVLVRTLGVRPYLEGDESIGRLIFAHRVNRGRRLESRTRSRPRPLIGPRVLRVVVTITPMSVNPALKMMSVRANSDPHIASRARKGSGSAFVGFTTTGSSPPKRPAKYRPRKVGRISRPKAGRTRLPDNWPSESLTDVQLSRSIIMTTSPGCNRPNVRPEVR